MKRLKFYKIAFLFFILLAVTVGGGRWLASPLRDHISFSREVYDRQGRLLRLTLSGDEKYRIWTPLEDIHPQYVESVLLYEDRYFFYHIGVNPVSLLKAAFSYTQNTKGPGASTITMQLARIKYGLKTQTLKGKIKQILYALRLEAQHSKKEILETYLNLIPFGGPIEGVGSASRVLFGKAPKDLHLSESLWLTLIPQNPTQRGRLANKTSQSPVLKQAFTKLSKMWLEKHPQDQEWATLPDIPNMVTRLKKLPFLAPHFTNMVLSESEKLVVKSTLDFQIQRLVEKKLSHFVNSKSALGVQNAVALVIHHETQEVLAYVGSKDFFNDEIGGQVNGVLAKRSPGSTLKPFVYALAFEQGLIHPRTLLKDTPSVFASYHPENFDQKFLGPITAEQALRLSRNIPAVSLNQRLVDPNLYQFLKKAHIHFPYDEKHYGLSLVLGGTEVSPWEMAHLYSMLANLGQWSPLRWDMEGEQSFASSNPLHAQTVVASPLEDASRLSTSDEKTTQVYSSATSQSSRVQTLLSEESSFVTLDILAGTPKPYQNYQAQWVSDPIPVAWKTGTSPGFRDAWTAGVMGPYTIVVWLGNFDNTPNPAFVGIELAAPLFFQIADGLSQTDFQKPFWNNPTGLDLQRAEVCSVSGHLPHEHCPHTTPTWFQSGVSPITSCDVHRPVPIDRITGLRSCTGMTSQTEIKVYEFWPTDLQRLFKQAGIHRKLAPAFSPECGLSDTAHLGKKPQITSPQKDITYLKSLTTAEGQNTLTLEATADSDSSELYWFIDKSFIGKSKSREPLLYKALKSGTHTFTVIDDLGRSDSVKAELQIVR
ncbi:MAG: penicillin-binding protein 1C [Bdellovibrionaceae bacterium]|nr:penicillin-binding protein 1C [Pseudobdellovibrionaceae bacterium]